MKNKLSHFAIYIDDIERAQNFYGKIFNWKFNTYGPSDFMQIQTSDESGSELIGALQARKYSPLEANIIGFECTINVQSIDKCIANVEENGGKIVLPKSEIPGVGHIAKFMDTEGNLVAVMEYAKR